MKATTYDSSKIAEIVRVKKSLLCNKNFLKKAGKNSTLLTFHCKRQINQKLGEKNKGIKSSKINKDLIKTMQEIKDITEFSNKGKKIIQSIRKLNVTK